MAQASSAAERRHLTDKSGAPALDDRDVVEAGMGLDAASLELTAWESRLPPSARAATLEMALDWADVAAMLGDYDDALAWLRYLESRHGESATELSARRAAWVCAAASRPR